MSKMLKFIDKGRKKTVDGDISSHGKLGDLDYKIYDRGVIHIYKDNLLFKKNMDVFQDEIDEIDFDKLKEGKSHILHGSGDNDYMVFTRKDGDIEVSLKKRTYDIIEKLKNILAIDP